MMSRKMPETAQKTQKDVRTTVHTVIIHISHADVQPTIRALQGTVQSVISNKHAEGWAEKCQKMATEKSAEQFITCTKELGKQR